MKKKAWYETTRHTDANILPTMLNFHLDPSIEKFNIVLESCGDPYKDDVDIELIKEELYVEYEDEDWRDKQRRIEKVKERLKTIQVRSKINWTNPCILAWVYAGFKQFPEYIMKASCPLILDRAHKFVNDSYDKLQTKVLRTPQTDEEASVWEQNIVPMFTRLTLCMYHASGDHRHLDYLACTLSDNDLAWRCVWRAIKQLLPDNEYLKNSKNTCLRLDI